MIKKLLTNTFIIAAISLTNLNAQQLSVFTGLSLATGDYSRSIGDNPKVTRRDGFFVGNNAGFASSGFGLGAEVSVLTGLNGLSWNSTIMFVINSSDDVKINDTFKNILADTNNVKFDYGSWIQFPIMTGLKYSHSLADNWQIYGISQVGITIIKAPSRKAFISGNNVDSRKYDFTQTFGYSVGFGLIVLKKFDIGLRYFNFKTPLFNGERKLSKKYFNNAYNIVGKDIILGQEIPVSYFLLTVGYHF